MDDVSKIQNINNLARELMKHGQASSMEEAIKMATQQVELGQAPSFEGGEQPQEEPAPEPLPEMSENVEMPAPAEGEGHGDALHQMRQVLDGQQTGLSRMTNTINALTDQQQKMNEKVNMLIGEITSLKEEVSRLKESPVTPPLRPKAAKEGQTQFKAESTPPPAPEPPKKEDGSGHARSGNYKPGDVSVEKFFYYGNK